MSWREYFVSRFGPGGLCGLTLGDWLRLLYDNRFAVDPPYWVRAALITAGCFQNSLFGAWEHWRHGTAIGATRPEPPLFILGIWRSGTTHLHNLLARDPRLAAPTSYEMLFPHTFLTTMGLNASFVDWTIPDTRVQDNVKMGMHEPQEDEFALNCLTQLSPLMGWTFPRRAAHYDRFLTFRDCNATEIARWQSTLYWLVQKLTYKHARPLLLKSPCHTARIRMLLEVFPDAKFVHIHRNPYDVFRSTCHLLRTTAPWVSLQRNDLTGLEERALAQYEELFDAFFAERELIPAGRLHDIGYEQLEANPLGELSALYDGLQLGDFDVAAPAFRAYLNSITGYVKNRYTAIEPHWKAEVARRWRRCFEEWGYAVGDV
jgi:omega-hydroxy-beta-dihydromenaquinone-9 sulfotransferase